ncbi:MarR family transcriptional regulator, partial [Paraburkholderia sp. SIMBA_009]
MTHVSITRPPLRPSALSIVVACATVAIMSGCANYIGIKSDKTLAQPQQFESSQSIPAQG